MNTLVIGSGSREHAIVWKCLQSKLVDNVFCAPGNAGIAMIALCENIDVMNFEKLASFVENNLGKDGLTIVGPDNPLAGGIVDYFEDRELLILGPRKDAALIEGSKIFAKNLMKNCGIPTGTYKVFAFPDNAKKYVRETEPPFVIKANGLALGKGVIIARNIEEADAAIDKLMATEAGRLILIEGYLLGWECSFIVLTDGVDYIDFPVSTDYKLLNGKMTGGMGGFAPTPRITRELRDEICTTIIEPMIYHMREDWRHPFKGFLYAGLMITPAGPKVLEFNARLGDPEAQVILPLLETDFVELCVAAAQGKLNEVEESVILSDDFTINVVVASPGYPDKPETGYRIYGLEDAAKEGALVFHAGTKLNKRGDFFLTNGGRVLSVVGHGGTLQKAHEMAYRAVKHISFGNKDPAKGKQVYRKDIAVE